MIHLAGVVFGGWLGDGIAVDCTSINGAVINGASSSGDDGAVVVSDNSGI